MRKKGGIHLSWPQMVRYPFDRLLRRAYRTFRDFSPGSYKHLLDIGAHEGSFTRSALRLFTPTRIWLVEADPQLADRLRRQFADEPRCQVIHCAIADKSGSVQLRINRHRASNSLLPISRHASQALGCDMAELDAVSVPGLTLDDLFLQEKIDRVDLCKVDIQGAECLLIRGGENALRRVHWLYLEVLFEEFYQGCAQFSELDTLLKTCDFKLNQFHDFRKSVHGDLAYGNALYRNLSWTGP